ncbi:MAG: 50S ribosomal protein L23 [Pyrobaculum sp.]
MRPLVIRFLVTEKTLRLAERENKIVVIVDRTATKKQVADEIKRLYNVEVEKVNTSITPRGEKKAYVKLAREHNAIDLLSKVGVM